MLFCEKKETLLKGVSFYIMTLHFAAFLYYRKNELKHFLNSSFFLAYRNFWLPSKCNWKNG